MITIDVKTKAVTLSQDVPVMARNQFGNATYGYVRGQLPPNYPLPAMQIIVAEGYDPTDGDYLVVANLTKGTAIYYWPDGTTQHTSN